MSNETKAPEKAVTKPGKESPTELRTVIAASSAGTLIEWYDFYIFGTLSAVIAKQFFPTENPMAGYLSTLAIFATGFIVRPFGALVFGRLGDLVGRKYAFLFTLIMMGASTFSIGLVPGFSQIGVLAPVLVLLLRLTQGLALGGEYGGAATYVAEYAPEGRRGYFTSFIQTTATLGFLVSIVVIVGLQVNLPKEAFETWGWRVPFLLSAVLLVFSFLVRRTLHESPLFAEMKAHGHASKNPLKESFGDPANLKTVLVALFGATMGQGVIWYTGQFYAQAFLLKVQNLESVQANTIVAIALVAATPLFVLFGHLSDRVGRKKIMMAGCLLATVCYVPIFSAMAAQADLTTKHLKFGGMELKSGPTTTVAAKDDAEKKIAKGDIVTETKSLASFNDGTTAMQTVRETRKPDAIEPIVKREFTDKKLPLPSVIALSALVFLLVAFVTMVYGPIAAFLVELFPTKIRYTSMSLPYHIGNGVFGGLVPFIAISMIAKTGQPIAGLYYPIGVAALTFVIGSIFLRDKRNVDLRAED